MPRHDYDLPIDWPSFSDAEKSRWYAAERMRRQHARQDTVSIDDRVDVHERRTETVFCMSCGNEHTIRPGQSANYCRSCGDKL